MSLEQIYNDVVNGEMDEVEAGVIAALAAGTAAERILQEGLIAAMDQIGKLFEEGEIFVPEMLFAARAMQAGTPSFF